MNISVSSFLLAARRVHHRSYRGGGLSTAGLVTILIFLAVCGLIVYFYIRAKKNWMMKELGFDSEADYKDFKQSCPVNYHNRFCMSDEWVLNENTFKIYSVDDVIDVSALSSVNSSKNTITRCGILIRYKGGTDKFITSNNADREKLLSVIRNFLNSRGNVTLFT